MNRGKRDDVAPLRRDLKAGRLSPCYLFYGEEDYLKRHCIEQVREALERAYGPTALTVLDEEHFTLDRFADSTENLSFGTAAQLLLLREVEPLALPGEDREALLAMLADLPEGVVVIFSFDERYLDGTPDQRRRRSQYIKDLAAHMRVVEVPLQSGDALRDWMERRLGARGLSLAGDAAALLLAQCDNRMTVLATELDKLAALCESYGERVVTRRMVEDVALPGSRADIYDIVGCMTAQDYNGALRRLDRCRKNRESPVAVTAALGGAFCELLFVKVAYDRGERRTDNILKQYGIKASKRYFIGRYLRDAATLEAAFPAHAVKVLAEVDRLQKSSAMDDWELLEQGLARIQLWREDSWGRG